MRTFPLLLFAAWYGAAWAQIPKIDPPPSLPNAQAVFLFDGAALPKDWKLMNPVENHWTMQPKRKSLLIATLKGTCVSSKDSRNFLVLDRPLPTDDFEVALHASALFQTHGGQIALALWSDDANYFWLTFQGDSYLGSVQLRSYFQKVFNGQVTGSFSQNIAGGNEVYLRIARDGNEFSGYFAVADPSKPLDPAKIPWVQLGTLPGIKFAGKLALCAVNFEDGAPEVGAEFYSVTLRPK